MAPDEEDDEGAKRIAEEWAIPVQEQVPNLLVDFLAPSERQLTWIEDGRGGVQPADFDAHGEYMQSPQRIIQQDCVHKCLGGQYFVSTVFLGIDHNFSLIGPPMLYETMIFYESFLHTFLKQLRLSRLIYRWERLRWRARFKWNINLPCADMRCNWQWRHRSRADALEGHLQILDQVRRGVPEDQWGESD